MTHRNPSPGLFRFHPVEVGGRAVPKYYVNLDALLRREYFEAAADQNITLSESPKELKITDLEDTGITYPFLRKPEFQRETSNWEPPKVAGLLQAFFNKDLIPAIILWYSNSGQIFVIDGAHRLSAFIAWVNDDYGDKHISRPFFSNEIPDEQKAAASRTRDLLNTSVGSYYDLRKAAQYPDSDPVLFQRASVMVSRTISLQWMYGEASTAERSYFTINQQATLIDQTELALIKARRQPHALATRALIRAGSGHKYWSAFPADVQANIESIAREVYDGLFKPTIEEPLKTLDLPVAGRAYSRDSVRMVFELVKLVNHVPAKTDLPDDTDGSQTVAYLQAVRRTASLISGKDARSLGLHPIVYCYSATGQFQPAAFLAMVMFIRELDERRKFSAFTERRERFEDFLLDHRDFYIEIGKKYGAFYRCVQPLLKLYRVVLDAMEDGGDDYEVLRRIGKQSELEFLLSDAVKERTRRREFSREVKNETFLNAAIGSALRCAICDARLHYKSISMDHELRKQDGGLGTSANAQMTHFYCNTGYKEQRYRQESKRKEGEGSR